jgi:hypothetical protein
MLVAAGSLLIIITPVLAGLVQVLCQYAVFLMPIAGIME